MPPEPNCGSQLLTTYETGMARWLYCAPLNALSLTTRANCFNLCPSTLRLEESTGYKRSWVTVIRCFEHPDLV